MYRFIETICIENGVAQNLFRHELRLNATRRDFFGNLTDLHLKEYISPPQTGTERIRCRVTYAQDILSIEYVPYQARPVHTLKIIEDETTDYRYKYADRSALDALFARRGTADDILIVRNGFLTDTAIANIALWDGFHWYTPAQPLLKGTRRAALLDAGILTEQDIPALKIREYQKIRLFNAMLPFGEIELPCTHIE